MFDKFLGKPAPSSDSEPKKKRAGRPKLPDHLLKHPRKDPARYSAKTGRLLPSKRKYKLKKVQWKKRRKAFRQQTAKARKKSGMRYERQYNASLRRKFIQARWMAKKWAERRSLNPETFWTLSYDDWLVLWATSSDVFHPEKGRLKAAKAVGNPIKTRFKDVCWASRRDPTKPWDRNNVVVMWNSIALPNKLNGGGSASGAPLPNKLNC